MPELKWPLPKEPEKTPLWSFDNDVDWSVRQWHQIHFGTGLPDYDEMYPGITQRGPDGKFLSKRYEEKQMLDWEFTVLVNWSWWPLEEDRSVAHAA